MKAEAIIDHLARIGSQEKAAEMARYHKVDRVYLGVANPVLNDIAKDLRRDMSIGSKVGLASSLWKSNLHEARILAAKILTQARMRPDDEAAWATIKNWTADFDAWRSPIMPVLPDRNGWLQTRLGWMRSSNGRPLITCGPDAPHL